MSFLQRGRITRGRKNRRNDDGHYWGRLTADSPHVLTRINECRAARHGGGHERRCLQAPAAILAESSTSSGRQSIETKPGVCSTRLSQARIAGKVESSKSQSSATCV